MSEIDISILMVDGSFREKFHALKFFAEQNFPKERYELIWVEYFSELHPDLVQSLTFHPGFRAIRLEKTGTYHSSYCFNAGIRAARGRLVIIPDADVVVEPHFLSELWSTYEAHPQIATYVHRFDEPEDIHREPVELEALKRFCILTNPQNYGGCLSVARTQLLNINGYEEHPLFGTGFHANGLDVYTRLRNFGVPVCWHPTLRLYHPWHPHTGHGHPFWKAQGLITQNHALTKTFLPYQGLDPALNTSPALWLMEKIDAKLKELANPSLAVAPLRPGAPYSATSTSTGGDPRQLVVILLAGMAILGLGLGVQSFTGQNLNLPIFTVLSLGLSGMLLLGFIYRNFRRVENQSAQILETLVAQNESTARLQKRVEALGEIQTKARENFRVLNLELGHLKDHLRQQQKASERRQQDFLHSELKQIAKQTLPLLARFEMDFRRQNSEDRKLLANDFLERLAKPLSQITAQLEGLTKPLHDSNAQLESLDASLLELHDQITALDQRQIASESTDQGRWAELADAQGASTAQLQVALERIQQSIQRPQTPNLDLSPLLEKQSHKLDSFTKNFWDQLKTQSQAALARKMVGAPRPPAETAPAHYRPGPDDILLVAYPGSGLELLRKVVAQALYGYSGNAPRDLDFFVPDLQIISNWTRIVTADFHFVKSYSPYFRTDRVLNGFQKIVYLRRDPTETLASQFRFLQSTGRYSDGADKFLADSLGGQIWPGHWAQHAQSWLSGPDATKTLLLDFEALNRDPRGQLSRLFSFCEIEMDAEKISAALLRAAGGDRGENWFQRTQGVEADLCSEWREMIESSLASQLTLLPDPRILLPSSQGASNVRDTH